MFNFNRIEKIDQELDTIFESPELLSVEKNRELNLIKEQIDKIYMKNSLNQVEDIYRQINKIYKSDAITKNQERILARLEQKLNQLFLNKSKADIAPEDEKNLEILNAQIDALYEMKEPSLNEIKKAEILLDEKETRYASLFIQNGQYQLYI